MPSREECLWDHEMRRAYTFLLPPWVGIVPSISGTRGNDFIATETSWLLLRGQGPQASPLLVPDPGVAPRAPRLQELGLLFVYIALSPGLHRGPTKSWTLDLPGYLTDPPPIHVPHS